GSGEVFPAVHKQGTVGGAFNEESRDADGRWSHFSASLSQRRIMARAAVARSPTSTRSLRRPLSQSVAKIRLRSQRLRLIRLCRGTGARSANMHASPISDG